MDDFTEAKQLVESITSEKISANKELKQKLSELESIDLSKGELKEIGEMFILPEDFFTNNSLWGKHEKGSFNDRSIENIDKEEVYIYHNYCVLWFAGHWASRFDLPIKYIHAFPVGDVGLPEKMEHLSLLSLWLMHDHLVEFPPVIRQLKSLNSLFVEDAQLETLPEWLPELTELTFLNVNENKLTSLPPLPKSLKYLCANDNQFAGFPNLRECVNLESIQLSQNGIQEISSWIGELTKLNKLHIRYCALTELPNSLNKCSIRALHIGNNEMKEFPQVIRDLKLLHTLSINGNPIKKIPKWISEVQSLVSLRISGTSIKNVPREVGKLKNLRELHTRMPQRTVPKWMFDMASLGHVSFYPSNLPWEEKQKLKDHLQKKWEDSQNG